MIVEEVMSLYCNYYDCLGDNVPGEERQVYGVRSKSEDAQGGRSSQGTKHLNKPLM